MQSSGPPALRFCSIPLSAFEGKRRRTGLRDTGHPHRSALYADRERTQWERPGLGIPGKWQWSRPRDGSDFRVARLCRKLVQGPKENTLGTLSRVEPQLCASWSQVNRIVQNTIGRSKKDAVPFVCQSLPVHIVSRSCTRLSGWNACAVLMNDHRPHGLDIVRDPEGVYGTKLQLPFGGGRRVNKLEISTCTARWGKGSPPILDRRNLIGRSSRLMTLSLSSDSRSERGGGKRRAKACHPFHK